MRPIKKIIVHCSATPPSMDIGADEIRGWHLERGWTDIGYAYIIRRDGFLERGRDLDNDGDVDEEIGAHTLGHNRESIGVCMIGGVDSDNKPEANFTFKQYLTLNYILDRLTGIYGATVHGHREYSSKACPSFDVQAFHYSADREGV